ncbi:unnamed protein product [Echinostoma caproni]|uniref:SB domain-containing protein n=1 Tax=Echinostoma caproni TaxID=27848 RepID=A0A183A226_9TREM|nr:unnamed protein product [Echinostoma caproni]
MESVSVLHSKSPSSRATSTELKLEQELKLAQLCIKKLELEAETSKCISEAERNLTKQISMLEEEELSVVSGHNSRPRSPQHGEKLKRITVARYTSDPACLLDHLISACEGEAAEAIQRCTDLEPQESYEEALHILERRFGGPHMIARYLMKQLRRSWTHLHKPTDSSRLKNRKPESQTTMSDKLQ